MGVSAGGFETFKKIIMGLLTDFSTPIFIVWHMSFIVWHMSPDVRGILPDVLICLNSTPAGHAYHKEELKPNRIYEAPPDHHMILEEGTILVTRGPKENRFRPAIDPLFSSAAYVYGSRVIGVILSGSLDDGTAGLWTVKHYGGMAVVPDPMDAKVPSIPENAMRDVAVDYCVNASELPQLLVRLSSDTLTETAAVMKDDQTKKEIQVAAEDSALEKGILQNGELSPYTCPKCHGVLSKLRNANLIRYRCHTGHAYSSDTLMGFITEKIEVSLYSAIRGKDESIMLLNHLDDHFAEVNQPGLAAKYFQKAKEAKGRANFVRKAALTYEQLSEDFLQKLAGQPHRYLPDIENAETSYNA